MTDNIFALSSDNKSLMRRRKKEKRFQRYGLWSIIVAVAFLFMLLGSIVISGSSAFFSTKITQEVYFDEQYLELDAIVGGEKKCSSKYKNLIESSLASKWAYLDLCAMVRDDPSVAGTTQIVELYASSDVDMVRKGKVEISNSRLTNAQRDEYKTAELSSGFNGNIFSNGDSRSPEQAGIYGALKGSILTLLICLLVATPIAIGAAVYLEEFAKKNKVTDIIEISINNLAAVPSIVYGLLALILLLSTLHLPRSSALVGGLALSFLVLPVVIIATRNALKSIPPSIKMAAVGLGASPMQVLLHHSLPLALPGIMTGVILAIARALGETAPLLMIGMVAFVADIPGDITSPATALPVQIYLWADSPEIGFAEKTSAAIMILIGILICANALAAFIRKKFEVKW